MKKVVLYLLPGAPASENAKDYLEQKAINYTAADVSRPANARKLARKTKQWNAPVLVVGEEAVVGFDETLYKELLSKR